MVLTDEQATAFGLLAMYAEDMYTVGSLNPQTDPRIAAAGWTIEGYLTAHDAIFPPKGAAQQRLSVNPTSRTFFGFVARSNANPSSHVAVIRGTDGMVEGH